MQPLRLLSQRLGVGAVANHVLVAKKGAHLFVEGAPAFVVRKLKETVANKAFDAQSRSALRPR